MKYVYLMMALVAIHTSAMCQRYRQLVYPAYKGGIRFNILGLIDPFDNNISIGGEYLFHPRWSITSDVGYIFHSSYLSQNYRSSGLIVKPGIRYYPSDTHQGFLELVTFYKGIGYCIEDWLGKACAAGVPAYDEYAKFTYQKRVAGINVQGGTAVNLSKDNALRLEFYAGLGIRFKWQHVKNDPDACYLGTNFLNSNFTKKQITTSSLPLGIRLVYYIE